MDQEWGTWGGSPVLQVVALRPSSWLCLWAPGKRGEDDPPPVAPQSCGDDRRDAGGRLSVRQELLGFFLLERTNRLIWPQAGRTGGHSGPHTHLKSLVRR